MFTKEQLLNAYAVFVREHREHRERFITTEEANKLSAEQEAEGVVDYLVAVMEGRDPFA